MIEKNTATLTVFLIHTVPAQEVEELEAQVALFGERQVLECRLSAVCEAQVAEAQMEAGKDWFGEEIWRWWCICLFILYIYMYIHNILRIYL